MPNQKTLAFTIQGGGVGNLSPGIFAGDPATGITLRHKTTNDLPKEYYWIAILDANQPGRLVTDFLIPGSSNSTVPAGLDVYMSSPRNLFVVATKQLNLQNVPKGDWYDYLVKYGAGSELQRLEQLSTTLQSGVIAFVGYVLTGSGGPRGRSNIPPPSYELSNITESPTILALSLIPMPGGQPPYSLIDSYTFDTSPKKRRGAPKTTAKPPRPKPAGKAPKKAGSKSKR
jgi:hypothetical protein